MKDNKHYKDYKIIFKSNNEEQRYFGSVRALLHTFPDAEIISVNKLKKDVN